MMVYMLDTIGSGDMLWTLFNALAALLRPNGGTLWQSFIVIGTAFGAVTALGYTVFRNSFKPLTTWFITTQVVMLGLIAPVATLHIRDELTGFHRSVDNVPFALAFTAANLSSMGTSITKAIETVFQPAPNYGGGSGFSAPNVDHLRYSQTGFMFAANVMAQMKGIQLSNDDMMDNMKEFVNQCVVYDALIGTKYTLHDLKRSPDLWTLVSEKASKLRGFAWRNVNRRADGTFIGAHGTEIITCKAGVDRFNALWRDASQSLISDVTHKVSEACGFTSRTTQVFSNAIAMNLPGALDKLTHAGKQASEQLQQQVMIAAILKANEAKTLELGGSPNVDVRRAYLQQRTMYQTIGETIAHGLPSLKNVLEAVIYALFIVVVLASMLPSGWKMFAFYTKLLLWIQLWPPLFAILNFIMTETLSSKTAGFLGTTEGGIGASTGITIANMVGLSNLTQDMAAIAGYLAVFIPVLSWALIELGGYSFVSMVSSVLGVSQSAATSAAVEKVHGNYSVGNVSLEGTQAFNTSLLKQDMSASYSAGQFATNEGITAKTVMADGETVLNRRESQMPVTISVQDAQENVLRDAQSRAEGLQTSYGQAVTQTKREAIGDYLELGKLASHQKEKGADYSTQTTASVMSEAAQHYEKVKQWGDRYNISEDVMDQVISSYRAGVGGGILDQVLPVHIGGDYNSLSHKQAVISKAKEEFEQITNNDSFRESMSHMKQANELYNVRTNDQRTDQLVEHLSGTLEKSRQFEASEHKMRDVNQSIQRERSDNQQMGARIDTNVTQEFINAIGAEHAQKMSAYELNRAAQPFRENHMQQYKKSVFKAFDGEGEIKRLDHHYQQHPLSLKESDVGEHMKAFTKQTNQQAHEKGVVEQVSNTPKAHAQQMMAFNTAHMKAFKRNMKSQAQPKEQEFSEASEKHVKEKFSGKAYMDGHQVLQEVSQRQEKR